MSQDYRELQGKTSRNVSRGYETTERYQQHRFSSSRVKQHKPERKIPSHVEAALSNIGKRDLLPPSTRGDSTQHGRSSETRRSPRFLEFGAPSYTSAVAGVTKATATSYKEPKPPDKSGNNST
jgi:hypothetical protein